MDAGKLSQLMGGALPLSQYGNLLPHFMNALDVAGITTNKRLAMWCAQIGHESVGLRYMEEIADGSAYEGRRDLGNVYPGDGRRFKGRGPIQLTGRVNYRAFTTWVHQRGLGHQDFEANPHLVSEPHWGFLAAAYYWVVARPDINQIADAGDIVTVTRRINGGTNGLDDRKRRYANALKILGKGENGMSKVLDYPRNHIAQDAGWFCGPASCQTVILAATGKLVEEKTLAEKLHTHRGGTDYIGQFPGVLNAYLPDAKYTFRDLTNYPDDEKRNQVWADITNSINAGYGVVANIVAPPSNYPKSVYPSTDNLRYGGGTIYHYFSVMGYADVGDGKRVWVADSGFPPHGAWISFDQLCTLIPPKGYAYATKQGFLTTVKELFTVDAIRMVKECWEQLRGIGGRGWPQLGKNDKGQDLSLVDGVAACRVDVANLAKKQERVEKLLAEIHAITKEGKSK